MAGGRGIFALDITDPNSASGPFNIENTTSAAALPLWEFNNTDDADMGYSFAAPSIVMMNNNRWAVVVGNGYNSTNSTGNLGSLSGSPDSGGKEKDNRGNYTAGKATLFILFVDGGLDGVWTNGKNGTPLDYVKITAPERRTTPTGIADPTVTGPITAQINCGNTGVNCNGLSTPTTVDVSGDSKIDRVYAGDLKGNMWAFDLRSSNPADWKVAYGTDSSPKPLFTASHYVTPYSSGVAGTPVQQTLCASNTTPCVQPITGKPNVIRNSKNVGYPNMLVFFGTGQYLTLNDTTDKTIQSFYGVWDHNGLTIPNDSILPLTPDKLVEQTITEVAVGNNTYRILTKNAVTYKNNSSSTTKHGWFMNFPANTGERQFVDTDIIDSKYLFFNTSIPGDKVQTTAGSCAVQGNASGTSFLMSVDLYTGGEAKVGLFDLNGSGTINSSDKVTVDGVAHNAAGVSFSGGLATSSSFYKGTQYVGGSDTGDPGSRKIVDVTADAWQRRSWQELRSY